MVTDLPKISTLIDENSVHEQLKKNFQYLSSDWFNFLNFWANEAYRTFRDHDKYLILIFIIKKTFDYYSANFIKLNLEEFYNRKSLEIHKFNINDIARVLDIPRETTRRKIYELEKSGILKKNKKNLIVEPKTFTFEKPEAVIDGLSNFLSKLFGFLNNSRKLENKITSNDFKNCIKKDFSYVWKIFYDMHIPNVSNWRKFHGDLDTFHIYGTCVVNQNFETQKVLKKENQIFKNNIEYLKKLGEIEEKTGINAMTISNLSGIPRATVLRKLRGLIKKKFLNINQNKLYHLNPKNLGPLLEIHENVMKRLSIFSSKVYNLTKF